MWKLIGISVLLASAIIGMLIAAYYQFRKPLFTSSDFSNFSRDIVLLNTHNPYTTFIDSHIFTVSSHSKYIDIKSTDWTHGKCQIKVDDKDKITGRIDGGVLGDNILIWGFNEIDYMDYRNDVKREIYNLLMLDPWQCNYTVLARFQHYVPKIITNEKSAIALCPKQTENCVPYRFDENGQKFELKHQIFPDTSKMEFLERFNQNRNYVRSYENEYGESTLQILDYDFNVLKETTFNFSIKNIAVNPVTTKSQIGILYKDHKDKLNVAVLDSNFDFIFTSKLYESYRYKPFMSYFIMDSRGNTYITSMLLFDYYEQKYDFIRFDANGRLIDNFDLVEYWRQEPLVLQTFLIDDSEYCMVSHYKAYDDDQPGRTYIKCITLS